MTRQNEGFMHAVRSTPSIRPKTQKRESPRGRQGLNKVGEAMDIKTKGRSNKRRKGEAKNGRPSPKEIRKTNRIKKRKNRRVESALELEARVIN